MRGPRHRAANRSNRAFHLTCKRFGTRARADSRPYRPNGPRDVSQRAMLVEIGRNAGSLQTPLELVLGVVDNDQVGLQSKDCLDVWIEQTSDPCDARHLGWKSIEAADSHEAVSCPHREDHFGDGWNQRHNATRLGGQAV